MLCLLLLLVLTISKAPERHEWHIDNIVCRVVARARAGVELVGSFFFLLHGFRHCTTTCGFLVEKMN